MCAVSLFGVQWYDVKTQADVDEQTKDYKKTSQAILNVRQVQGFPFNSYDELKEAAKTALKSIRSDEFYYKGVVYWLVAYVPETKKYVKDLLNDDDSTIKYLVIQYLLTVENPNFTKEQKNEFIKDNIVAAVAGKNIAWIKQIKFKFMLNYYVKNIMPAIDEKEAKTVLKTLNKYIYPLIGEDAEMKDLAVKIKLALESLE